MLLAASTNLITAVTNAATVNPDAQSVPWPLVLTTAKDVITALAAIIAVAIALTGIRAWKRQLRGKTDYELARKFLRAAYKVRNGFRLVRNPFVSAGEVADAIKEATLNPHDADFDAKKQAAVYNNRLAKLWDTLTEFQAELLEAEVSWGKDAVDAAKPLNECVRTLRRVIFAHVNQFVRRPPKMTPEKMAEIDDVLYEVEPESEPGQFDQRLSDAIARIESFLKPHLK